MKRGFTLIELQVTLLLTLVVLALLFLFTLYFWRNGHHYADTLGFTQDARTFFDWVDGRMRNTVKARRKGDHVLFQLRDGREIRLELDEAGPRYGQQPFFSNHVSMTFDLADRKQNLEVAITITHGDGRTRSFRARYFKHPFYGLTAGKNAN